MNNIKNVFFIALFFFVNNIYSQKSKAVSTQTDLKTVEYENGRAVFNVCKINPNISFNENFDYFWYNEYSKIKNTKGSSGGLLLHGKFQFFDNDGNLKIENNYNLGIKDGSEKEWGNDGEIKSICTFKNGKVIYSKFKAKDSDKWIEWNGPALEVGSVKKTYTSYGQLLLSELQLEELRFKVTSYYNNNNIKEIYTTDILDKMYDEYIKYYENGKMKVYGKYENNHRVGEWKWFKENGEIESIEKNRINKIYSTENVLISEGGEYFDEDENKWMKNGMWFWYDTDGKKIIDIKDFKFGEEVIKNKD